MKAAFRLTLLSLLVLVLPACDGGGGECFGNAPDEPIDISVGGQIDGCVGGSIGDDQKHYQFTVGAVSSTHTINLQSMAGDLGWQLYEDPLLTTTLVVCDAVIDGGGEVCQTPELASGRTFYLRVTNFELSDGPYRLLVSTP